MARCLRCKGEFDGESSLCYDCELFYTKCFYCQQIVPPGSERTRSGVFCSICWERYYNGFTHHRAVVVVLRSGLRFASCRVCDWRKGGGTLRGKELHTRLLLECAIHNGDLFGQCAGSPSG
jgi:hypothetical protein